MRRPTLVWLALVLATVVTGLAGAGTVTARVAVALAVVLAFGKAAAVGLEFMELRRAGAAERRAFLAWIVVVGATCLALAL